MTQKKNIIFTQLNFWGGRLYYPITRFFERIKPDIFSAQEIFSEQDNRKPSMMTLEMLLDEDHQYFNAVASNKKTEVPKDQKTMCCATFTKNPYKIDSQVTIPLSMTIQKDNWGRPLNNDYYSLLHTKIKIPDGHLLNVLNIHNLVIFEGRMGNENATHIFKQVTKYIEKLSGPIILSGDFNLHKNASSLESLKTIGLQNLNDLYHVTEGRNEFAWKAEEIVSHIFINEEIDINDYYVADDNVSDHKALVLSFNLKK